ncbi:MAG: PIN domain-containing protein [Acidobacteria bacterium]|nr:PIN domain-containing protein [Acidobacteriota bacterium]MYJ05723.1 PIN domain-containing protein [Acidobacteriota bacterium]
MTSFDSNILLYGFSRDSPFHNRARSLLEDWTPREDVAVSELVLVEFYTLLRNPAVLARPLSAREAVEVVQAYRRHPRWMLLGFDTDSVAVHEELWSRAAESVFGRRRVYDARLAFTLRRQGVTEFATANVRDFQDFGFERTWSPFDD